ncbi:hypothetical protein H7K05_10425 [Priestia aryabhattai]|uniref:hypothetical protein n=1 Tax=Priestia aryabhattai TaxID=412384 RepID=UPI001C8DC99B|nr:hypothetical protein [Priestia aryabhattai]MBY0005740.1 hypothetical protein [Priestia aryabhattai]MBY0047579.1 hypothetical protein [Priestia aryabhattai]
MFKRNNDIRGAISNAQLTTWLVAEKLGVHENTLFRKLRKELTNEEKIKIMSAIKELTNEINDEVKK